MSDIDWSPVTAAIRQELEELKAMNNNPRRSNSMSEIQVNDVIEVMKRASRELSEGIASGRVQQALPAMQIPPEKEFVVKVEIPQKVKRQIFKLQEEK